MPLDSSPPPSSTNTIHSELTGWTESYGLIVKDNKLQSASLFDVAIEKIRGYCGWQDRTKPVKDKVFTYINNHQSDIESNRPLILKLAQKAGIVETKEVKESKDFDEEIKNILNEVSRYFNEFAEHPIDSSEKKTINREVRHVPALKTPDHADRVFQNFINKQAKPEETTHTLEALDVKPKIQTVSNKTVSAVKELSREEKLSIIQKTIPKEENGYPSVDFNVAIDLLAKQSLKPTLLLIDEVDGSISEATKNQIELIKKVKEMGGQIIVCCRPGETNFKVALKEAIADYPHTYFEIWELSKLENQKLKDILKKSDYVIPAGYDINECVRATVGALSDDTLEEMKEFEKTQGLLQEEIPILFPDKCSQGKSFVTRWEGARFEKPLFFWGNDTSNYRIADQAIKEYRKEMTSVPIDFNHTLNQTQLTNLRMNICHIRGLTTDGFKNLLRLEQIAPDNPLLDQITGKVDK